MDEIRVAEAQTSPSRVTAIGGAATADGGTGGAAKYGALSVEERETLRQTLTAAHPDTIPELILGETVGEIIASLATAKAVYQRTIERTRAATPVAAGGGGRAVATDINKLSPLAKIAAGLKEQ